MPEQFKKMCYPAHLVKHLKKYPVRHCSNPLCGRQLTPNVYKSGLEQLSLFKLRETCGHVCRGEKQAALRAVTQEAKEPEPQSAADDEPGTPPSATPVTVREVLGRVIDKRRASKVAPKKPSKPKPKPVEVKPAEPEPESKPERVAPSGQRLKLPDPRKAAKKPTFSSPVLAGSERRAKGSQSINLLLEERAQRIAAGTFDPTPGDGVIVIDGPLRTALVQAMRDHDPDFIEQWEQLENTQAASRETQKYAGAAPA